MGHGISLLPDCRKDKRSAAEYYRDVLEISRFADREGIDYVKMTEHYLGDYGGYCPSPLTFLAAVATQTERIRLMTGALLPAFHHPIQLAAHIAQVDAISNGRVEAGFGRAWLPYEFEALGVPIEESRARYEATIKAVVRLWTEEKVTEDTPFFSFKDATSLPPVVQRPHPPVWGAAVRSPESFTWLAENGFGLQMALAPVKHDVGLSRWLLDLYRDTFKAKHGPDSKPRIAMSTPLFVAETDEEAYRLAEPVYREYMAVWSEAASAWKTTSSDQYKGYDAMAQHSPQLEHLDLRRFGTAVIGSPSRVVERIQEFRESLGIEDFLWQIDFGGQDLPMMERSMRLFVDKVLPQL
ncbi:LLM class flavin-dependent oxidoreductase [Streptomyces sp. NPDC001250]|uniref:LLM class flavin-dependent oxidoreductase n=1 Tax=unclassified Streptomyces TaxID=2593676 RepID=UPI00332C7299